MKIVKLDEDYGVSNHYTTDREKREELIRQIGPGRVIRTAVVDRHHPNGPEIHEISDTGIITIYNQRTGILVTRLIARPGQIRRYYNPDKGDYPPRRVLDLAREHQQMYYNYM